MSVNIDIKILKEFEEGLNTRFPDKSKIPAKIIGFGEISTVFIIDHPLLKGFAFKRLPLFSKEEEIENYEIILKEYIDLLKNEIGINVLETAGIKIQTTDGRIVYYIAQPVLPEFSICNNLLHKISESEALRIFNSVLINLKKVRNYNDRNKGIKIGIDEQLSNWAIKSPGEPISDVPELVYLDISTPLFRKNGKEALNADLFLKSTPPLLRTIVKALFLKEILDRYYDFRLIVIDMLANLFKEKLHHLIQPFIEHANNFFKTACPEFNLRAIEYKEVEAYYRNDAFIWSLFLSLRKLHREIVTGILRRRYEFILPDKIER
jgi:hypothetical protein